jgi:class 3 adenylate cyclase
MTLETGTLSGTDETPVTRGFLFADLRDYTGYVEAHGDAAGSELLDVYRLMVRDAIAHHGGAEIKTEGDSFYVVFPSASGAVICGLGIVAAAASHAVSHPDSAHIRVGVGVHAGESVASGEGYVGSAVNIAARVCALAKPGEVVVTETVRSLTRTSGRLQFVPLGKKHLKGIAEPFALFRAEPVGAPVVPARRGPVGRRRAVLVAMAGVLLLVATLSVLALGGVLGRGGFAGSGSPTPRGTEPAETEASDGTLAPIPFHVGALDPGVYASSRFQPPVQFRIPSGWIGGPEQDENRVSGVEDADFLALSWGSESGIFMVDALVVVDGCFAEENFRPIDSPLQLIDHLSANTNLLASNPVPKTVGGYTGYSITISNARIPNPGECPPVLSNSSLTDRPGIPIVKSAGNDYWVDGDHVVSVISLAVGGHILAIFVESPPENTLTFQAAADDIIKTVSFPEN